MERYYTPDFDEICVGLEMESHEDPRSEDGWVSFTVQKEDIADLMREDSDVDYRVKYLDHDDIVSLGFKLVTDNEYVSDKTYLGLGTGDDAKLHIHYYLNSAAIWFRSNRGDEYTMFDGWIKNKFELKKILKQILNE